MVIHSLATNQSDSYVSTAQYIKSCKHRSRTSVSIYMNQKGEIYYLCDTVVGARWVGLSVSVFQLLICDFHAEQSLQFMQTLQMVHKTKNIY